MDGAPDLVLTSVDDEYIVYGDFHSDWFRSPPRMQAAGHDPDGILILRGRDFRRGTRLDAAVEDVTPTLLFAHDLPLLADMDGEVLLSAFEETRLGSRKPRTEAMSGLGRAGPAERDESDEGEFLRRLEDLGYA
jgi:hypothetical protein